MADRTISFASIAHVYNRFTDLTAYDEWLTYTLSNVPFRPGKALDVGCGTGYFARLFAKQSAYVLGVDIDPEMLKIALRDTPASLSNVEYRLADMLSMEDLPQDFQVVTCYADALCFLENEQAVVQALKNMYQRLVPGGILLFDAWTPYQMTQGFKDYAYHDADEEGALLWDSFVTEETLSVVHEITVFDQLSTGMFKRIELDLYERTYSLENFLAFLQAAGFNENPITVTIDYGASVYQPQEHFEASRWFFRVEK